VVVQLLLLVPMRVVLLVVLQLIIVLGQSDLVCCKMLRVGELPSAS
jgi:hypothetical protein